MTTTIQAIETEYAGCRFRSRIEARWAVFFDALDVEWHYEAQGFELPSGARYLPDFWLPQVVGTFIDDRPGRSNTGVYFEVKGPEPSRDEAARASELDHVTGHMVVMAWGEIPRSTWVGPESGWMEFGRQRMSPRMATPGIWHDEYIRKATGEEDCYLEIIGEGPLRLSSDSWFVSTCGALVGVGVDGGGAARCCGGCRWDGAHPRLLDAYQRARSARFEFDDALVDVSAVAAGRHA